MEFTKDYVGRFSIFFRVLALPFKYPRLLAYMLPIAIMSVFLTKGLHFPQSINQLTYAYSFTIVFISLITLPFLVGMARFVFALFDKTKTQCGFLDSMKLSKRLFGYYVLFQVLQIFGGQLLKFLIIGGSSYSSNDLPVVVSLGILVALIHISRMYFIPVIVFEKRTWLGSFKQSLQYFFKTFFIFLGFIIVSTVSLIIIGKVLLGLLSLPYGPFSIEWVTIQNIVLSHFGPIVNIIFYYYVTHDKPNEITVD